MCLLPDRQVPLVEMGAPWQTDGQRVIRQDLGRQEGTQEIIPRVKVARSSLLQVFKPNWRPWRTIRSGWKGRCGRLCSVSIFCALETGDLAINGSTPFDVTTMIRFGDKDSLNTRSKLDTVSLSPIRRMKRPRCLPSHCVVHTRPCD